MVALFDARAAKRRRLSPAVRRLIEEEPLPLKMVDHYSPYHEAGDVREARAAVVALRLEGWRAKVKAVYLGVHHATLYRALERWKEGGRRRPADVRSGLSLARPAPAASPGPPGCG